METGRAAPRPPPVFRRVSSSARMRSSRPTDSSYPTQGRPADSVFATVRCMHSLHVYGEPSVGQTLLSSMMTRNDSPGLGHSSASHVALTANENLALFTHVCFINPSSRTRAARLPQNSARQPGCKPWREEGAWHLDNRMQINGVLLRKCTMSSTGF